MIFELKDTSKVEKLFEGWEQMDIYACMQQVMGKMFVTDPEEPRSAMAYVGCFAYYAGEPDRELVSEKPKGFVIMVPQNDGWAEMIESCFPEAYRLTRYAIRKDTEFDIEKLKEMASAVPEGYEIRKLDGDMYDLCLVDEDLEDFVSVFETKEQYLELGRGVVILKDGNIVSGASSYSRYLGGLELEVDTKEEERRKGLATAASATLILQSLREGLYPSWDAANTASVHLAEKLGYELDHPYTAYGVEDTAEKEEQT